ncbi:glycosyltransferase family A protein [Streptomyces sp. NPDC088124]|uniref:glycosyltransferase family A protein n=1 Tax=Streptomyces sp. NPDC088124 TaxID=3154654 RepID=UPI003442AA70
MTAVKITVVVPTYNSGPHIEPLVDSLLRQTMPRDAFEVLFVDDGSTDGTPARLAALAAEHPHFHTVSLPNSGWPGRPRNVGVARANGAYVQFADHDDRLAPEALERLYAMAERNGSDILIGKVASNFRARGVPYGLMSRTRESCTVWDAPLIDSLTPHKMFRTAFLREHGIVHPEGPWILEDQLFMARAYLKASVVSVLGDYVCYTYWARDDAENAGTAAIDPRGFYRNLRQILATVVAGTEPGPARDRLLRRFYRVEMLHRLGVEPEGLPNDPPFRDDPFDAVRELADEFMTDGVHDGLPVLHRVRSTLLRANRPAELTEFTRRQSRLRAHCAAGPTHWNRGRLKASFTARFEEHPGGPGLLLARRGERYFLAPSLTDGVLAEPVDVTDALGTFKADVLLRHTESAHVWPVARETSLTLEEQEAAGAANASEDHDGTVLVRPVVHGAFAVDPLRAAGGRPLDDGAWEVRVRLSGAGFDRYATVLDAEGRPLTVRRTDPPPAGLQVSVVVRTAGAAEDAVRATLDSLAAQTLPRGAFEVIRAEERDTGLAGATGAYVLFLEPGTELGTEALERLYAYGVEHDADIVAGKPAGRGRPVPRALFARDRPRATLAKDPLADSLGADKLFDRAFLAEHGLRFGAAAPEAGTGGRESLAEQAFTAEATLLASRTAVLGSYVCYRYGPAPDGPAVPPGAFYPALRAVMARADARTGPGAARDRLHRRWLRLELLGPLTGSALPALDDSARSALFDAIREVVRDGVSPTAVAGLPVERRVAAGLIADGLLAELVTLARWETSIGCRARLDRVTRRDDGVLRITFTAHLHAAEGPLDVTLPDGEARRSLAPVGLSRPLRERFAREPLTRSAHPDRASAVLVLRDRGTGKEHRLPTESTVAYTGGSGLSITGTAPLAAAGLRDGVWDASVRLTALGWTKTARLGAHRTPDLPEELPTADGVTPYRTTPGQDLSFRVTTPRPAAPRTRILLHRVTHRLRGATHRA